MPNKFFQFKQFTVHQNWCAMKVGTDGVLLGAWADCRKSTRSILDIGTGSGLIALMLAQRSEALIDAIDIEEDACRQAIFNVDNSPFQNRINVIPASLQDFHTETRYDLIICNPPFFSNALKCPDEQRNNARHNDHLPFDLLLKKSAALLNNDGKLALIIPFDSEPILVREAGSAGLYPVRKTLVRPKPHSPYKRILIEFSREKHQEPANELIIELERHIYSSEYIALTQDFYLKM